MNSDANEDRLLVAANLYYMEELTQEEIASRLGCSRVAVTRMLKKCKELGLVKISVKKPMPELYRLSLQLERRFRLKAAVVVESRDDPQEGLAEIGRGGAQLLERLATPGCGIGVAWSATVSSMIPFVHRLPFKPGRIHELAGTYLSRENPYGVSWPLAEKLGVGVESIPMPVLVRDGEVKDMMLKEPAIHVALDNAAKVDLAFVGIGNTSPSASIVRAGYIGQAELAEFSSKGAVGDILMRYYGADGRYIPMSFEDRTISLEWEQILRLPMVVALAFGPDKLAAISGALAGRAIHGLVTDRQTAICLLEPDCRLPSADKPTA